MTKKQKLILDIVVGILNWIAWIWLLTLDWKIGVAVFLIMWSNNIGIDRKYR